MSNVNGVSGDSADIEIRIQIFGNKFQEQHYFKNGRPRETPKEFISYNFAVKVSTPMTKFMKKLVFPIFEVPLEKNDYIISLQMEGQPQEIFDQENMNGKTISEVGIKHLDALTIMIVHKDYNNWSPPLPPSPQLRRKSKRITEGQRERQTKAVRFQENAARQEKLEEKKKQEVRTKRDKTKDAMNNPMAIQNKKIKIAGEGLRLSDGKKVTGDITTKKMAAQQNNGNNLMASGSSTTNSLSNSLKGELLIWK